MSYKEIYDNWKTNPEAFWMEAAKAVTWSKEPTKALFDENAPITNGSKMVKLTRATTLLIAM